MIIKLQHDITASFPRVGLLIQGGDVGLWLTEVSQWTNDLDDVEVYPLPGTIAPSVWGCLIIAPAIVLDKNERWPTCHAISDSVYVPNHAVVQPQLSTSELETLFPTPHFFHPEIGVIELSAPIQWQELLVVPEVKITTALAPQPGVHIPSHVKSFVLKPVPPEDLLKSLEEQLFSDRKPIKEAPLNTVEKAKLRALRLLFGTSKSKNPTLRKIVDAVNSRLKKGWQKVAGKKGEQWVKKMQEDLEKLETRNQKEADKLLDLFKRDLDEALKHALPISNAHFERGSQEGSWRMSKAFNNFSLTSNSAGRGRSVHIDLGDKRQALIDQYETAARICIDKQDFKKAAFIYLKLLDTPFRAAETLELGGFYQEAASLYLDKLNNKQKAAECYEKARITPKAIELYTELGHFEKVGDLQLELGDIDAAHVAFDEVVANYVAKDQYVKAALIYRNKKNQPQRAQALLMQGWQQDKDAANCLNNYLEHIDDIDLRLAQVNELHRESMDANKSKKFLWVLQQESKKNSILKENALQLAYQIVAKHARNDFTFVDELRLFDRSDKYIFKDALNYKQRRRRS